MEFKPVDVEDEYCRDERDRGHCVEGQPSSIALRLLSWYIKSFDILRHFGRRERKLNNVSCIWDFIFLNSVQKLSSSAFTLISRVPNFQMVVSCHPLFLSWIFSTFWETNQITCSLAKYWVRRSIFYPLRWNENYVLYELHQRSTSPTWCTPSERYRPSCHSRRSPSTPGRSCWGWTTRTGRHCRSSWLSLDEIRGSY